MNNLQVFENERFGKVRTIKQDNNIWFCAKDVCDILEIKNVTQAMQRLEDDERSMFNIGRQGDANFTNESGLYTLILRSDKTEAKPFRKWVTSEVIPAIRKTGMYATDELLNNPDLAIKAFTRLKEEQEKRKQLEAKLTEQAPKIDFYNDVTGSETTAEIGTVAKLLNFKGVGRNTLFDVLRKQGVLQANNIPYQKYVDNGYFRVIESKWNDYITGDVKISFKTVVYQKGVEFISKTLRDLGYQKIEIA